MFIGLVNIVKRKKILHCGYEIRMGGIIRMIIACNNTWNIEDRSYEDQSTEVTCKKCLKILAKADEYGKINR